MTLDGSIDVCKICAQKRNRNRTFFNRCRFSWTLAFKYLRQAKTFRWFSFWPAEGGWGDLGLWPLQKYSESICLFTAFGLSGHIICLRTFYLTLQFFYHQEHVGLRFGHRWIPLVFTIVTVYHSIGSMYDDLHLPIYNAVMGQMCPDSESQISEVGKVSRQIPIVSDGICYINRALSKRKFQAIGVGSKSWKANRAVFNTADQKLLKERGVKNLYWHWWVPMFMTPQV